MNQEFEKINIENLRAMTQSASGRLQEAASQHAESQRRKAEATKRVEQAQARVVIEGIPDLLEQAALKGKNHAKIMRIDYLNIDRPYTSHLERVDWSQCDPNWLKGSARFVYDYCVGSRLNPTLDYDHDGVGVESWWNLTAHW